MLISRTFSAGLLCAAATTTIHGQQLTDDLPLGLEVVTGYRSEYVYRGFKLADKALDVQLEGEVAVADNWVLSLGGWYGTGDDDFRETSGYADLDYIAKGFSLTFSASYHDYTHEFFQSGLDAGASVTWEVTKDWDLTAGGYYDTGAEGFYGKVEAAWSHTLSEDSYVSALAGVGSLSGYYDRSGFGDVYSRLAYTYTFNPRVAVTPFVGSSLALDDDPRGGDSFFAGVWFEVNF
jgi:hypothetical protein